MIYDFLYENLNFLRKNLRFSLEKILMIFCMIFLTIHKISYDIVRVSTGSVETRWLSGSFLMVYRNNGGRLGSGFISACLETRWLGPKSGFYVPERYCTYSAYFMLWYEFAKCRSCMFLSGTMHGGLLREVRIYTGHLLFNFCQPTQSTRV